MLQMFAVFSSTKITLSHGIRLANLKSVSIIHLAVWNSCPSTEFLCHDTSFVDLRWNATVFLFLIVFASNIMPALTASESNGFWILTNFIRLFIRRENDQYHDFRFIYQMILVLVLFFFSDFLEYFRCKWYRAISTLFYQARRWKFRIIQLC